MYEYDAQGQMTKMIRYNSNQVLTLTQTLTYDARGDVVAVKSSVASPDLAYRTFHYDYDNGRNPYFNRIYFASAFFLSRNNQLAPGLTYEYRSDGLPTHIRQNGGSTELTYY